MNRIFFVFILMLTAVLKSTIVEARSVTYIHSDLLGTPIVETDEGGNVIWRDGSTPYGKAIKDSSAASTNTVGFTGHQKDRELGLTYMQARYYDPVIGRFYSNDPVGTMGHLSQGNIQGFNRYNYAYNNPYKYTDPDGRLPFLIPVGIFLLKEGAAEVASQATGGATDFLSTRRMAKKGLDLTIKMKKSWDASQRTEATQKVEALNKAAQNGDLSVVKKPQRSSTSPRNRYESQNGEGSVGQGNDADHTIELQLGGSDTVDNIAPLNSSVNRSVGAQIQQQIKNQPAGTKVCSVKVCDG